MNSDWEHMFPLVSVWALETFLSDHTPLLLDAGNAAHAGNQPLLKFELGWLNWDGFYDLVAKVWQQEQRGFTSI